MNLIRALKKLFSNDTEKPSPINKPVQRPRATPRPVEPISTDNGDCRCIHCHKEFWYEDFIGLCTTIDCSNTDGFRMTVKDGKFHSQKGPRQILLRDETTKILKDAEEYPIKDQINTKNHICPSCNSRFYIYACPVCRNPMPRLRKEDLRHTIAPVGIGSSGKSIFMTVLINQLFEEAILKKPIKVISNFSEKTDFDRYRKKHAQIFRNKSVLASNLRGEIPHPYLLATMTRRKDQEKDLKAYTLWYDFAGEDYEKSDEMDAVIQYFTAIGGIFFLVDPSNSEKVVKILGIEANDPDQGANEMRDEGVLTQIGSIVGKHGTDESFHQKHIAVIVSKVDLFKDSKFEHFREDSIIWQPSPHQSAGEFSLDDFRQVNEEVEKYLMKYHKAIYGQIVRFHNGKDDIMESNVGYFAVSALGQNPVGDRKVGLKLEKKVSPIRVEDPFYWMLWKMGHLPASSEEAPSTPPPEKEEDEGSFGGGGLFD